MQKAEPSKPLVGIDVGGTFTDFVVLEDGELTVHKVPTTPQDQSLAIVSGMKTLGIDTADVVHGMTVATNALLERRGAKTALLTTEGFADVLVIGRQNRPQLYHFSQERPAQLVEQSWRLEVAERMDADGNVLTRLEPARIEEIANLLRSSDVESLAVVFLFSFRNPDHEARVAEIVRERCPDLPVSLSSEILPEYREYERAATTVINAYVQPLVSRYLHRLERSLAGSRVRIMQSNGGAIGLDQAAEQAARVVLSGPAGGVVGAFALAQQALDISEPEILSFDMGGTSTDVALCPGRVPATAESIITDVPLRLPVIDIHTVGAGGGSVAVVDAGGGLRVGPRSAGAVPGPACYGRGGEEVTVTDANLLLGRLDPGGFLGGEGDVTLDTDASARVLGQLGESLGLTAHEAALGVVRIANATMERALRRVSVEQGFDPRRFALVPFGGAGPLHSCDLADSLGIERILIPPIPGVLSAYGMLVADIVSDASQSVLVLADEVQRNTTDLRENFDSLRDRVSASLVKEGVNTPLMAASVDMRYRGQSYELTVPLTTPIDSQSVEEAIASFHAAHEQRYGYTMPEEPVELVNLRVRGSAPGAQAGLPEHPLQGDDSARARLPDKPVWFSEDGPVSAACYARDRLSPGNRFAGPALVFQYDSTIVVAPTWNGRVDRFANIWLEKA